MNTPEFGYSCKAVNALDLVDYLARLGHSPLKIRGVDYWYLSPLRTERTPSFKVNRQLNVWYDHGEGKGGTLVDFGLLYFNCSLPQFLTRMGASFLLPPPVSPPIKKIPAAAETPLKICAQRPIQSLALQRYLHSRKIPIALAQRHLREVVFSLHDKRYVALGFPNRSGGYELRNDWFKGSSAPKDFSYIVQQGGALAVFEGFFDYLSFLAVMQKEAGPRLDFLVLNSLSFTEKCRPILQDYKSIRLFFDHDKAGDTHLQQLLRSCRGTRDERGLYQGYKDLNDWLMHMGKGTHPRQRPPFHSP